MNNIFIFLAIVFILTFIIGHFIEKFRVPWIFSALLIGTILSAYNPFSQITNGETFNFLAQLGMYFLLFIIGFEIDLNKLKKAGNFIIRATFFIILFESIFGTLLIHFIFGYSWFISFLVALSFATVGEAILVPILDEFNIINTTTGQSIISIGALDDVIELILLTVIIFVSGNSQTHHINIISVIILLFLLFIITFLFKKFKKQGKKFRHLSIETLFLFLLFIFFLFLGIGENAHAGAIAALLAGVSLRTFLPNERIKNIKSEIKTLSYGFFAPIFFIWVGAGIDIKYIISYPVLILIVIIVSSGAKMLGSLIVGKNKLGLKKSLLLGTGLSVRFSTSLIIIKILYESGQVNSDLYSVIIASSMLFTFMVQIIFSRVIIKFNIFESSENKRLIHQTSKKSS